MGSNNTLDDKQFIIDSIKNYFEAENWNYKYDAESNVFSGGISLDGPLTNVNFTLFVNDDSATCFHSAPFTASKDSLVRTAEYLTRVNFDLLRGNFELDFNDGEIRYKHRISLADIKENSHDEISWLVILGSHMFEKFSRGMMAVIFNAQTPEEAFQACLNSND